MQQHPATPALDTVREFYQDIPFNYYESAANAIANIQKNPINNYPDLDELLEEGDIRSVLELGCGAGWASNSLALHYNCQLTSIDFTKTAVERAIKVAELLGTKDQIDFRCQDLFKFNDDRHFDLVMSIGVLHHTADCHAGVRHAASFVAPGGLLYLGLYHSHGRLPFLAHYQNLANEAGEEEAYRQFCETLQTQTDPTHAKSWFRDQVLHPFETQHSFEEVYGWLAELGLNVLSTSINGFEPLDDLDAVFAYEKTLKDVSIQRNVAEKRFYPGFFTVLAERG